MSFLAGSHFCVGPGSNLRPAPAVRGCLTTEVRGPQAGKYFGAVWRPGLVIEAELALGDRGIFFTFQKVNFKIKD